MTIYTIINNQGDDNYTGTLEQIREQLIHEAFKFNRLLEEFEDQVEAVSPADPSELDDDEERLIPRELTRELLVQMASSIWDVHTNHIQLIEDQLDTHLTAGEFGAILHSLDLTPQTFAALLKINDRTVRNWLTARREVPVTIARELELLVQKREDAKTQMRNDLKRGVIVNWILPADYINDAEFWEEYPDYEGLPVVFISRIIAELATEKLITKTDYEIV